MNIAIFSDSEYESADEGVKSEASESPDIKKDEAVLCAENFVENDLVKTVLDSSALFSDNKGEGLDCDDYTEDPPVGIHLSNDVSSVNNSIGDETLQEYNSLGESCSDSLLRFVEQEKNCDTSITQNLSNSNQIDQDQLLHTDRSTNSIPADCTDNNSVFCSTPELKSDPSPTESFDDADLPVASCNIEFDFHDSTRQLKDLPPSRSESESINHDQLTLSVHSDSLPTENCVEKSETVSHINSEEDKVQSSIPIQHLEVAANYSEDKNIVGNYDPVGVGEELNCAAKLPSPVEKSSKDSEVSQSRATVYATFKGDVVNPEINNLESVNTKQDTSHDIDISSDLIPDSHSAQSEKSQSISDNCIQTGIETPSTVFDEDIPIVTKQSYNLDFDEDIPIAPKKAYNLDFLDNLDDPNFNPFGARTTIRNSPPPSVNTDLAPLKPAIGKKKRNLKNNSPQPSPAPSVVKAEDKPKKLINSVNDCSVDIVESKKVSVRSDNLTSSKQDDSELNRSTVSVKDDGRNDKGVSLEISLDDDVESRKKPRKIIRRPPLTGRKRSSVTEPVTESKVQDNIVPPIVSDVNDARVGKSEEVETIPIPAKGYDLDFLDDPNFNPFNTKSSTRDSPKFQRRFDDSNSISDSAIKCSKSSQDIELEDSVPNSSQSLVKKNSEQLEDSFLSDTDSIPTDILPDLPLQKKRNSIKRTPSISGASLLGSFEFEQLLGNEASSVADEINNSTIQSTWSANLNKEEENFLSEHQTIDDVSDIIRERENIIRDTKSDNIIRENIIRDTIERDTESDNIIKDSVRKSIIRETEKERQDLYNAIDDMSRSTRRSLNLDNEVRFVQIKLCEVINIIIV